MSKNVCVKLIPTANANGYPKCIYSVMNTRSSEFSLYVMLIMKITLKYSNKTMQGKQSSPSHKALNVELWDQISVH
jgi:tellurite resistance-related uncharacterized protein